MEFGSYFGIQLGDVIALLTEVEELQTKPPQREKTTFTQHTPPHPQHQAST